MIIISRHFAQHSNLRLLRLESIREALDILFEVALVAEELNVATVDLDPALLALSNVLLATEAGEAPVLADDDLLATGELELLALYSFPDRHVASYLVLRPSQSLKGSGAVGVPRSDGQDDLTNVDARNGTVGLTEGTTHTRLQSIGTGTRQHLVDSDDVVRVGADAEMETFLSGDLDKILVGTDTGSLERLRGQLLVLVGDQVDA